MNSISIQKDKLKIHHSGFEEQLMMLECLKEGMMLDHISNYQFSLNFRLRHQIQLLNKQVSTHPLQVYMKTLIKRDIAHTSKKSSEEQ